MARISGGALARLPLVVPRHIRATQEKVRQALFNIVGSSVVDARVIDGFAGSGALGFEALSRGADLVVFLESHPACIQAIRHNASRIASGTVPGHWEVRRGDVLRSVRDLARRAERFDLAIFDPPYEGDWGKKTLRLVAECGTLSPSGLVCLEHTRQNEPPAVVGSLALMKQHRYGETVLSFYRNSASQNFL